MNIFEYGLYKDYLNDIVGPQNKRLGVKSKMAQAIGCQSGYLSQVLNHDAHLSLEQAEKVNLMFAHTQIESHYFLLLVQYERAGTPSLKKYFKGQIDQVKKDHLTLHRRVDVKYQLSSEDQSRYYSSWHYCAIHMGITLGHLQTAERIATHFKLPLSKVSGVLSFLIDINLIKKNKENFEVTNNNIYIDKDSPNIGKHHTNWRLRAIDSLDQQKTSDLHYSGLVTISQKDAEIIKEELIRLLHETLKRVEKSKEEDIYCMNLDFFKS